MGWREDARAEIEGLKPHFVEKYNWAPRTRDEEEEQLDLFVTFSSRRLSGRKFVLRLRYRQDWQSAGRRETFVNPLNPSEEGIAFWPPQQDPGVRAVNPNHSPPCVCLRGTWGYHSVLHPDRPMGDSTLLTLLLELQAVLNE